MKKINRMGDSIKPNPVQQFKIWYKEAKQHHVIESNVMTLATVSGDNKPSARIVLLRGIIRDCFIFYTNYESRKGKELQNNPNGALVFYWRELQRQVRIEGFVEKLPVIESDRYFRQRSRGKQISAWASRQSQPILNRDELLKNFNHLEKKFADDHIPRPDFWGGYSLNPEKIEFWQNRNQRLHDRFLYTKKSRGWIVTRLSP